MTAICYATAIDAELLYLASHELVPTGSYLRQRCNNSRLQILKSSKHRCVRERPPRNETVKRLLQWRRHFSVNKTTAPLNGTNMQVV